MFVKPNKLERIYVEHCLKTNIFGSLNQLPKITRKTGKSMLLKARFLFLFLMILFSFEGKSQVSFDSPEELEKAANEFFDAKEFAKAKPLFSQLLSKNALDPDYNYRFGVCILYTEADPLKPLPYIEGGANSPGVNTEAYYFLGKAYQLNYRFEDAITAYQKGKSAGLSKPNLDLDRSIEECRNGKILYNSAIDFQPAQNKEVIASEFYRPYDFRKLKGKVIPMPPNFKTKYDEKHLSGTVVYTPTNSQTLVYASYGEDGANAKDLYRVNRLPNGELALPQRLPNTINTKYDEDYAFYDEEAQVLFFASKGHNTMGGYDVFSSKFDADKNNWSTPLNLQYPVNSPFDDFLYVSDPGGKVAFFTSERNVEAGKLRVMKTLLHDPLQVEISVLAGTYEDQTDSIYNYAALTVLDPVTNEVVGKYRSHKQTGKYLLILSPQNNYTLNVGPREADGFKFDLDVPKHESVKPLQQGIVYNTSGDKGTVTVTNYFDGAGKSDSVAFAESRSLAEFEKRMIEMPDPTEILAAKQQVVEEKEQAKQDALALEKAKQDSIKRGEELAILEKKAIEEAEKDALAFLQKEAEKVKQDSIKQAEVLTLQEKTAAQEVVKKAELAKAQKLRLDSINQSNKDALALKGKEDAAKAEQAREDSLKRVEELALQKEKAALETTALAQLAKAEKLKSDSIQQAEKNALALHLKEIETAKKDSLQRIEALAMEEEKAKKQKEKITAERDLVILALEKARQDSIQEVAEFNKLRARHIAQRAKRDSINKAIELAELKEAREKFMQDSLATIELALEQERETQLELLNDRKEVLTQIKEIELKAELIEKERLANIDREVEMAKQQAMRDSLIAPRTSTTDDFTNKAPSASDILKEMAEKEAEILNQSETEKKSSENELRVEAKITTYQPNEVALLDTAKKQIEKSTVLKTEEITEETLKIAPEATELTETETISESELFLQTIAKLEAQKKNQETLVSEENEQRKIALAENARELTEAQHTADTTSVLGSIESGSDKQTLDANAMASATDTTDIETSSVALKSDANPEEYLAALNQIEKEIAKEAEVNTDKSYELKEISLEPKNSRSVEPLLQAKIDADRKALAEHQKIAIEKERALKEQMQRDKTAVKLKDKIAEEELAAIENEMSNGLSSVEVKTTEPSPVATKQTVQEVVAESNDSVPRINIEEAEKTEPTIASKGIVSEKPVISEADQEVLNAMAEFDKVLDDKEEIQADNETKLTEELKEQVNQAEIAEAAQEIVTEPSQKKIQDAVVIKELTEPVVAPQTEAISSQPTVSSNSEIEVGNIPFMAAALRDYGKRKPSFDKIEDPSIRRMVKRMRSEDIGRIAVLKNMKNQWIEDGKTSESVKRIKDNIRNRDVLETVASTPSREEYVRPPFDKNTLKKRQDVHYKIAFEISTARVSETISEAMSPEQAISFSMPEFDIQSGYYQTLADANSDLKEYKGRGFDSLKVVPYLKNEAVQLSDVIDIPFVD